MKSHMVNNIISERSPPLYKEVRAGRQKILIPPRQREGLRVSTRMT